MGGCGHGLWDSAGLERVARRATSSYVLAVPATKGVYHEGTQRQAQSLAKDLPAEAWERVSAGTGSKGERLYD